MPEDNFLGPVKIRDVAARAGVAMSSVSRVLSGHPDVSPEMRTRVEEAVKALGYEPDLLAQSLRSGSTRTIGFIIRDISNPLYALIARSCEQELRRNGYSMILMNSDGRVDTELENFTLLRRRRVDGVIASLVAEDAPNVKKAITRFGAPFVLLDREIKGLNSSAVITNHFQGIRAATKHLLDAGHINISFISGKINVFSTRDRLRGFNQAFADAGKEVNEGLLALGEFDSEYAFAQVQTMMSKKPCPTALIAGGIASTSGALRALNKLNIKIGKDLAFVAVDEWPLFDLFSPPISSVYRDSDTTGNWAASLMLEALAGTKPRTAVIDTRFTPRFSSQGGL